MTITKLLAGAAVAALLAGAAQAQVANTTDATSAANLPASGIDFVASEFQPAAAVDQLAGSLVIDSTFGAAAPFSTIPVDGRARLSIDLTNATFTSASGATFTAVGAAAACAFESAAVTGGGVGSTSVGFISSAGVSINGCVGVIGEFTMPVARTDSSLPMNVEFTYTQVNADGSAVASPVTAADDTDYADIEGSWDSTTPAVPGDHGFAAGTELTATSAGILSAGTLGTISTDFRVAGTGALDIFADDGSVIAGTDLFGAGSEILITFPGGVGDIDAVAISGATAAPVCTGPVADVFTCTVSALQLAAMDGSAPDGTISYTVTGGGTPPVTPEQTPTAELVTDNAADYVAAGFTGDLAEIKHDNGLDTASVTGTFAWVRFGAGGTESNFRISVGAAGVPDSAAAAGITEVRVTVADGNGVTGDEITLLPGTADTGFQIKGSTIVFNSRALGAVSGETGNANITGIDLQFDETVAATGDVIGATIDRQLVNRSPASFVATPGLE